MIINIRYKTPRYKDDLITIDFRLNQIRYLIKPEQRGFIHFINISQDDADAYLYLFKEDKRLFFKSLREDLFNNDGIKTQLKYFEIEPEQNLAFKQELDKDEYEPEVLR